MKFDVFEELIKSIKKADARSFEATRLGIDLVEYDTEYSHTIWLAIRAHYGKEAADWIEWYLYERESLNGDINQAWDKDGTEICHTIESLWKVVEEIRLSPNFVEYTLPAREEFDPETVKLSIENFFNKIINTTKNDTLQNPTDPTE